MDDVLNSPNDWPQSFQEFNELENLLRCSICFELLRCPLMVPKCSHNYCSLCIRRHLLYKNQCPICSQTVAECELQSNRELGQIVELFGNMRSRLLRLVKVSPRNMTDSFTQVEHDLIIRHEKLTSFTEGPGPGIAAVSLDGHGASSSNSSLSSDASLRACPQLDLPQTKSFSASAPPFGWSNPLINNRSSSQRSQLSSASSSAPTMGSSAFVSVMAALVRTTSSSTAVASKVEPLDAPVDDALLVTAQTVAKFDNEHMDFGASYIKEDHKQLATLNNSTMTSSSYDGFDCSQSQLKSSNKVNCPVCNVPISEKYINIHLDRCLEKGPQVLPEDSNSSMFASVSVPLSQTRAAVCPVSRRPQMPKLVYHIMKDPELRKKLSAVGLSCFGTRDALINRHREFTLRYNAECDQLNPKSAKEIVADMLREERNAELHAKSASPCTAATDPAGYEKQNRAQFSQLVQDARSRLPKKDDSMSPQRGAGSKRLANDKVDSDPTWELKRPKVTMNLSQRTDVVSDAAETGGFLAKKETCDDRSAQIDEVIGRRSQRTKRHKMMMLWDMTDDSNDAESNAATENSNSENIASNIVNNNLANVTAAASKSAEPCQRSAVLHGGETFPNEMEADHQSAELTHDGGVTHARLQKARRGRTSNGISYHATTSAVPVDISATPAQSATEFTVADDSRMVHTVQKARRGGSKGCGSSHSRSSTTSAGLSEGNVDMRYARRGSPDY